MSSSSREFDSAILAPLPSGSWAQGTVTQSPLQKAFTNPYIIKKLRGWISELCIELNPYPVATRQHRQGKARQGKARQGKARQGKARQGKARQGKARQGKARQGKARQGKARQGKARQSKATRAKGTDDLQ